MNLIKQLLQAGTALSVGSLSLLALHVEPAKADTLDQSNQASSAKEFCDKQKQTGNKTHFWGRKGKNSHGGGYTVDVLMTYDNDVYIVDTIELDDRGRVESNSICLYAEKIAPLNKQITSYVKYQCMKGICFGGYSRTQVFKREGDIDLIRYIQKDEGEPLKLTYRNFAHADFTKPY